MKLLDRFIDWICTFKHSQPADSSCIATAMKLQQENVQFRVRLDKVAETIHGAALNGEEGWFLTYRKKSDIKGGSPNAV